MDFYIDFFLYGVWTAIAALGFGIFFNVPPRTIFTIVFLGFGAGLIKFITLHYTQAIVLSCFLASSFVGILSVPLAHKVHTPPVVFSVPAIIPMIPGSLAYKLMLALLNVGVTQSIKINSEVIITVLDYGIKVVFIMAAITLGVSLPKLLFRKETIKKIKTSI